VRYHGTVPGSVRSFFSVLGRFRAGVEERLGKGDTETDMELMRALVQRLPHNNLCAATRAEIQAAGQTMLKEGYSREDMGKVQSFLAAFFDQAVAAGLVESNVIRSKAPSRPVGGAETKAILVVGFTPEWVARLGKFLARDDMEIFGEHSGTAAAELANWYPFRIVLSRFPVPGLEAAELLAGLRGVRSMCRHCGIILAAEAADLPTARALVGQGANLVIPFDAVAAQLHDAIAVLEGVSRRAEVRIPVRVFMPDLKAWHMLQSVNLSETGLLVRCPKAIAKGVELDVELSLPGESLPIRVRGEVVRATSPRRETVRGIAVRFLSFHQADKYRYDTFLRRLVTH